MRDNSSHCTVTIEFVGDALHSSIDFRNWQKLSVPSAVKERGERKRGGNERTEGGRRREGGNGYSATLSITTIVHRKLLLSSRSFTQLYALLF
jgi:hypothetical protein